MPSCYGAAVSPLRTSCHFEALRTALPWLALAAPLTVALLSALCSLWWPYGWDHGCFAYVADVMRAGGEPYRDAWDFKGPLTFYVFYAVQLLTGPGMWGIRLFDLLMVVVGLTSVWRVLRVQTSTLAALWTVVGLTIAHYAFGNYYTAQPDNWCTWAIAVCVMVMFEARPSSLRSVASIGALIGACALIKPNYGLYLLLPCVWIASEQGFASANGSSLPSALKALAVLGGGFGLPIAACAGWFAGHGVLHELVDIYVVFTRERIATDPAMQMSWIKVLANGQGLLFTTPTFAAVLPMAAAGVAVTFRRSRTQALLLALWPALALFQIMVQRKFWFHNYTWHALYPSLSVVAAMGMYRLWTETREDLRVATRLVVGLTAALLLRQEALAPLAQIQRWVGLLRGKYDWPSYVALFDVDVPALQGGNAADFGFGVARDLELADYLRDHTQPGDTLTVWSDPLVNHLAVRKSASPVTLAYAFTVYGAPARRQRYRTQLLAALQAPEAKYFGAAERDLELGTDDQNIPRHFPELLELMDEQYTYETTIGDVRLFRRRAAQ